MTTNTSNASRFIPVWLNPMLRCWVDNRCLADVRAGWMSGRPAEVVDSDNSTYTYDREKNTGWCAVGPGETSEAALAMFNRRKGCSNAAAPKADHKIKTAAEKSPVNLIPLRGLTGTGRVFQHGAVKYEPGNYALATVADGAVGRYCGATLRHLAELQGLNGLHGTPGALDAESGLPHIDHAIASLLMLRAVLTQEGVLPMDPGPSKFVKSKEPT